MEIKGYPVNGDTVDRLKLDKLVTMVIILAIGNAQRLVEVSTKLHFMILCTFQMLNELLV